MNKLSLTQTEFDKLMKSADFEQYTEEQFNSFILSNEEILVKANGTIELDELEKSEFENLSSEINSFAQVEIWKNKENSKIQIEKSITYIRPKQVEWTEELVKSEDSDEMIKSKSGIYTDTSLNRKLGRVGRKYGQKKEEVIDNKMKTFNSAEELKKAVRENKSGKIMYDFSKIKSINGYSFRSLSPEITKRNVSVYDSDTQEYKHFYPPFKVEFK